MSIPEPACAHAIGGVDYCHLCGKHFSRPMAGLREALLLARGYIADVAEGLVIVVSDSDPRDAAQCDLETIDAALERLR